MALLFILVGALAIQVLAWILIRTGFRRSAAEQPEVRTTSGIQISVIVAARNEEERIGHLLMSLAQQTYKSFELVVVDDASEDSTTEVVESFVADQSAQGTLMVSLIRISADERARASLPPKKHALSQGIAVAKFDRLAFTDADGRPGPEWLAGIAAAAHQDPEVLLIGYGPYTRRSGLLNAFIRYETFLTAVIGAAAAGFGRPFLAVGRNFSYTRTTFERVGGFAHSAHSLSGDDDLFVQEIERQGAAPVRYVLDEATFVESEAPTNLRSWVRQKRRHQSAGRYYPGGPLAALSLFHASNLALWLGVPATVWFMGNWYGAGLLAAKLIAQRGLMREAEGALAARDLTLAQPALDGLYAGYQVLAGFLGVLPVPKRW